MVRLFRLFDVKQMPGAGLPDDSGSAARMEALVAEHQRVIWVRTDRLFAGLMVFQWIVGMVMALSNSPRIWDGAASALHPHVWAAVMLGGAIIAFPIYCAMMHPGRALTRHVIAAGQMLSSALLIHIGDGRIEMHFHIFGSLAFLAFYRDWKVLVTATVVIASDHLLRGIFAPTSVYGVIVVSPWRTMEHAVWVVFEDVFLIAASVQSVREMRGIASRQALLEQSHHSVEEKVRERTRELKDAQEELVRVARSAGMAEIATSVLHNVGNVLNSVNVSVDLARTKVRESPVSQLSAAVALVNENRGNLPAFLTNDQRGRAVPEFLEAIADVFSSDQKALLEEMNALAKNVEHIKQIVNVQQSHARTAKVIDDVDIHLLLEDALKVSAAYNVGIDIVRRFAPHGTIRTDRHALLQILINLISNARHAVADLPLERRRITIITRFTNDQMTIRVADSGVGIRQENLTRIFNHGFTTRKDGHGFGLHASAIAANQLGGTLKASSEGQDKGAEFILELPLNKECVTA